MLNLKLFGCFTAAVWYSLPRYVIQHGRFTTLGRAMVAAAAGVTVLMFVTLYPWLSFIATEVAGR